LAVVEPATLVAPLVQVVVVILLKTLVLLPMQEAVHLVQLEDLFQLELQEEL
jgi:hypothetical protein